MPDPQNFELAPWVIPLVTMFLLPLLNGLITRLDSHPLLKTAVNAVLSFVVGMIEAITGNNGVVDFNVIMTYFLAIWAGSHLSYKMIWKPVGGGRSDPVRLATPTTGI